MENLKKNEGKEVNRHDVCECLSELNFINDNLCCVRWGLASGDCANPKVIDNALYLLNCRLDEVIAKLDKAVDGEKEN